MIDIFKEIDHLSPTDFELFVRDLLLASGWTDAVVTEPGKEFKHGDGGVDIFAYKAGRKFAIEVKQRNTSTTVDVKALNQLVTGARLGNASNMILVTNSYFTSEVQIRALRLGVELIDREELQNLWVKRHSEIGRDIKPRKYQSDIIDEAIAKYDEKKQKILIEMATGLGKTYTVALLIKSILKKAAHRKRVLFVAHQVEILLQSVTAFKNVFGIGGHSFSACFAGSEPERTDFVFASFDTLYSQLNKLSSNDFNIVVIDEAHHTPASTYSQVAGHFNPEFLIGLTATPYRTDNKDVLAFFGGPDGHIGKYDLIWALRHRWLAFPKYLVMLDDLDQEKIDQLDSGLSVSDIDNKLFLHKKDEEVVKIIESTVEEKNIENVKGIVFCRNLKHMNHLLKFFELGTATSVHSKMLDQQRRDNIRKFREGSFKYILVCDLFNEGVDIPETNLLVFMRHTGSRNVWLQQLGRGLRKTPNKDYVHVLDFVGSLERLDEVHELKKAIQRTPIERENVDDPDDLHDTSIEVKYSRSAAKVLALLEQLKYRLTTRERLLDQLREFREHNGYIPPIDELEGMLPEISLDQIATHFDSYYGYLDAAFYSDFDKNTLLRKAQTFIREYENRYGIIPSARAVMISFIYANLPEFSEREILPLLSNRDEGYKTENSSLSLPVPDEENTSILSAPATETIPQIDDDSEINKNELLRKYVDSIQKRADLKLLSSYEIDTIKRAFGATSVFLSSLKRYRNEG
jgi:superfamily II DNA or RNA helicase